MKTRLLAICVIFIQLSCGVGLDDDERDDGKLSIKSSNPDAAKGGLAFKIKNRLVQHKPDLSIEVCAIDDDPTKKIEDRALCISNPQRVKYGAQTIFHVNKSQLEKLLLKNPKGEITLRFNDTYSNSLVHWFCWEHPHISIDKSNKQTQSFGVTVTQSNNLSYSCRVKNLEVHH